MRVFVAGATGGLGRRLIPALLGAGHEVVGTTRNQKKLPELEAMGARGLVLDGLDKVGTMKAVAAVRPDVVIHQLTALSSMNSLKHFDRQFATTNELRTRGIDILLEASQAAGVRRFIAQSYTGWPNPRTGGPIKDETDPLDPDPDPDSTQTLAAIAYLERTVTSARGIEGLALRYGGFYGPGNGVGKGGEMLALIEKRQFPIVGQGTGIWSMIHIDDAASATTLAVDRGAPGLYNIVDDEPAPVSEWLPYLATAIGAPRPFRIPVWLARPVLGSQGVSMMTRARGSSNAKAHRGLGWQLRYPSWRDGFRHGLG